jgi:hypothetical protein
MPRALITIHGDQDRVRAARWCAQLQPGSRVEFKDAKRSLPQNDRLWAMLTDVASQVPWHGVKLTPDDWKLIFLDGLKRELNLAPNLDGDGLR